MWKKNNDGAIHALGNGRFLVYGRGNDIAEVYGPPYSSPSMLHGKWALADGAEPCYESCRDKGTNRWRHKYLNEAGREVALAEAFVASELPVYLCRLHADEPLRLELTLGEDYECYPGSGDLTSAEATVKSVLVKAPDTARIYRYPMGEETFLAAVFWGQETRIEFEPGTGKVGIAVPAGESYFALAGGPSYPEAEGHARAMLEQGYELLRAQAEEADHRFSSRIASLEYGERIGEGMRKRIDELSESVAFLIAAQQSQDGGIMAGHNYALAYVRDQYGASRGLLSLGLYEEARRNLAFRYGKWTGLGGIRNAESMGHDRARHVHENDDVEITAYMIVQAFDYGQATGDWDYVASLFPMLDDCWQVQLPHLHDGMLPFNGDETYVAGGFLPRTSLNDGSMEATLLFLEAGRRLLPFAVGRGLWNEERAAACESLLERTEAVFRTRFRKDGRFYANAPERAETAELPAYRHGVCESCHPRGIHALKWTRRTAAGRYVCPACLANEPPLEAVAPQVVAVQSAGLLPSFVHAGLLTDEEKAEELRRAYDIFERYGYLPTVPGSSYFVGYDESLLLYGLTLLRHPGAEAVLAHVVSIADSTDAWVEYYDAGRPFNTRCRPWESGMNIAAVRHYAEYRS
ncbi:hypothetical protein [Cohnella phaseoli]|uniref:Uncharacterized protein n=1 Tax=Cohnella phaseoli TaxID=456490 RepID=A0A3D9I2N1_9BACL|nr:hypothetical protein [Cohnella phaseoli]RED55900.1 hypothetical protein DFP98_14127 [Cohnella phaseoli]